MLSGQSIGEERPWMIGAGIQFYDLALINGTGIGPSLVAGYRFDEHFGMEFSPMLILHANGYRTFLGAAGDLGASYSLRSSFIEVLINSGLSALVGVDASGGGVGRGGIYIGGEGNIWVTEQLGIYGRLTTRVWVVGYVNEEEYGRWSPSYGGGLIIRF